LPGGHGAVGRIIKVSLPTMVVSGPDNLEKVVMIKDDTIVRQFRSDLKPGDLKIDQNVVVVGSPNEDGQIEAKLIRLMPAPGTAMPGPGMMFNSSNTPSR